MDWEQSKENCIPVRHGRATAALQELADPTDSLNKTALEQRRKELWDEVVQYAGDDPLEPWQRYIKWMQEHGGGKADLQKVLETCTKELLKQSRYASDARFLRIWIQYADCLPDPADVFLFLKEKGIGRDFALYYEAYATYFELRSNYPSADAVYMDGINRGAKPLERLKQKYGAFQQRMAQRIQRKIQDEAVMGPTDAGPPRASLAALTTSTRAAEQGQQRRAGAGGAASSSIFGAAGPGAANRHSGLGLPHQGGQVGLAGLFSGNRTSSENYAPAAQGMGGSGSRLGLHVQADAEFSGAPGSSLPFPLPGYSTMPQVNNLRELKPFTVMRKENQDKVMPWSAGIGLQPQAGSGGTGAPSSLEILTDDEFKDEEEERASARASTVPSSHPANPAGLAPGSALSSLFSGPSGAGALPSTAAGTTSQRPPASSLLQGYLFGAQARAPAPPPAMPPYLPLLQQPQQQQQPQLFTNPPEVAVQQQPACGAPYGAAIKPLGFEPGPPHPQDAWAAQHCNQDELSYEELRAQALSWRTGSGAATHASQPCAAATAAALAADTAARPSTACAALFRPIGTEPATGATTSAAAGGRTAPLGQVLPAGPTAAAAPAQASAPAGRSSTAAAKRPLADLVTAHAPVSSLGPAAQAVLPFAPAAAAPHADSLNHLTLRSASSVAVGRAMPEPTITLATRDAFDVLNSMFNDDLPSKAHRTMPPVAHPTQLPTAVVSVMAVTQPQAPPPMTAPPSHAQPVRQGRLPFGALPAGPAAAAAHQADAAHPQPVAPAASTLPLAQRQDQRQEAQQALQQSCGPASHSHPEPTVTLFTKQAFESINDMFSTALPHEEARKAGRRTSLVSAGATAAGPKPVTATDVCRLANMGRVGARPAAATGAATAAGGPGSPPAAAAGGLAIYEDTVFLPSGCSTAGPNSQQQHLAQQPPACASAQHQQHFAAAPSSGGGPAAGGGMAIYEDTVFLPGPAPRTAAGPGGGGELSLGGTGSAGIYEDTEFVGGFESGRGHSRR